MPSKLKSTFCKIGRKTDGFCDIIDYDISIGKEKEYLHDHNLYCLKL